MTTRLTMLWIVWLASNTSLVCAQPAANSVAANAKQAKNQLTQADSESELRLPQRFVPSFRNDVMAILSRSGCNMGTCHGNANGKGGFKLSLRGQNPGRDFHVLTRELGSRRVSKVHPRSSLLLRKPAMIVPHQGGRRFDIDSPEYRILENWIAAGMPNDEFDSARLNRLSAVPAHSTVYAPNDSVQLEVFAEFDDGSRRNVTGLSVFESSALFVEVNPSGIARTRQSGQTCVTARYLDKQIPIRLEFVPERPGFKFTAPAPANFIDKAVFDQLKRLRINPSQVCSDNVFIRRAHLDVTGLLPPAEEAREFLRSNDPNKRAKLIDRLLASEEFNDMQALRWCDLLKVEERVLDQKGMTVFHHWIRDSFAKHKPLSQFAKELIEARGSTYKIPPANFYRTLRTASVRGEAIAQVFLGIRLQCAQCHNHPFDRWTQEDYYGWSNYFGRIDYKIIENKRRDKFDKSEFVGEQIVQVKTSGDVINPSTGKASGLRFLGTLIGTDSISRKNDDGSQKDRPQQAASWLTSPNNERFAATQANRIWYQLMGRGIVDPVDDFRSTNPPTNPKLLAAITKHFKKGGFRVRPLMRAILNSRTYQLSATINDTNADAAHLFARVEPRRLTAEQTLDAISQVVGVPVPFGDHTLGTKAVQLTGVRDPSFRYAKRQQGDDFLALFGKPIRQLTCECERSGETTLAQTFELCSGDLINELLKNPKNRAALAIARGDSDDHFVNNLYWTSICRDPTNTEKQQIQKFLGRTKDRRQAFEDIVWALLNSNEMLLRH